MAQTVDADKGEVVFCTDGIDGFIDPVGGEGDHILTFRGGGGQGLVQGRYDRHGAPGGGVFILLLVDKLSVLVIDSGAVDTDRVSAKVDVRPLQIQKLGTAEAGQSQQRRDLNVGTLDSCNKVSHLLGGEPRALVADDLRELDGDHLAGSLGNHRGNEAPGIGDGLCAELLCLSIYGTLPLLLGDGSDVPVHHRLEAVVLNDPISTDGRGGHNVATGIDVVVDGLGEGDALGAFLRILDTGLECHGFGNGFLLCGSGDADILAVDADTAEPGAGGELPGCWCFHLTFLSGCATLKG